MEFLHKGQGLGAISVDADRIGLQLHRGAVIGKDAALSGHPQNPGNGLVLIFNDGAGGAAGHQGDVGGIAPVGKHLAGHRQADDLGGLHHPAA